MSTTNAGFDNSKKYDDKSKNKPQIIIQKQTFNIKQIINKK
jgi:hypothetical protein